MTDTPTTPPPDGLRPDCDDCPAPARVWREPPGTAACEAHDRATVRPSTCACGRPEIPGHACQVCAAPQWVGWPTHPGWWWIAFGDPPMPELVLVNRALQFGMVGDGRLHTRPPQTTVRARFLDARLTPPVPPEGR